MEGAFRYRFRLVSEVESTLAGNLASPRDARLPFMNVNVFPIGRSDSLILIIERGEEEGGEREKESLEIIEEGLPRICRVRVTAICIPDITNYMAD